MTTMTAPPRSIADLREGGIIQCRHCPASTRSAVDVARLAGWRLFVGESMTGKPLTDVVCPTCAGTAAPEDESASAASWRVRCSTCDWSSSDDQEPGEVLDAKSAKGLADDHRCEPQVEIAPAAGDKWFDPYYVNDDGTVREPKLAAR